MKPDESERKINISKRKESPSENSASPLINNEKYVFYNQNKVIFKECNAHTSSNGRVWVYDIGNQRTMTRSLQISKLG